MVHLNPLPGTPYYVPGSFEGTIESAVRSSVALESGGADGCLIQTVDRVYSPGDQADPARIAAMSLVVQSVVRQMPDGFAVGAQMMRNAVSASLAVARVAGGTFVRAGAIVGMTMSPQGPVTADPLGVAEYRNKIDANQIRVIADVNSMQFQWFGPQRSTGKIAHDALLAGADAVAVSDSDVSAAVEKVASIRRRAPALPVLLAGNTSHANAEQLLSAADGAFVGSCLEAGGWGREIDVERVAAYVKIARSLED